MKKASASCRICAVGNYFTDELSNALRDGDGNKIYACLICRVLLGCPAITNAQPFELGKDIFGNAHLQHFNEKVGSDNTGEREREMYEASQRDDTRQKLTGIDESLSHME